MSLTINLPCQDRTIQAYAVQEPAGFPTRATGPFNRIAFAAAHVVADPLADIAPWEAAAIDWDRTLAFREHLWNLGFGVAEAMDTAQRGMGMDWSNSLELIRCTVAAAKLRGGALVFSGAGTDQLPATAAKTLDDVIRAYDEQVEAVENAGGRIILMASRALARLARTSDDYLHVYGRVLSQVRQPVILHWLGAMFDPALTGYWGGQTIEDAMDVVVALINDNRAKIDGIKLSLLDARYEIALRRRLPLGVHLYTGDDFNYPDMIAEGEGGHSHALLGIFAAIAPAASAALSALAAGDETRFRAILGPTVPLSRHLFAAPTPFYKTGVVFLAYLNGHQDHFTMVGGLESARSALHLAESFRLADQAGLLADPALAVRRMQAVMATRGIT